MRIIATAVLILLTLETGASRARRQSKERNHNYILRRQEAGLVSGVPTIRRIIGKREIDIYPNGSDVRKRQRGRCLTQALIRPAIPSDCPFCGSGYGNSVGRQ